VSRLALTPINAPALASAPTVPTLRAGDLYYDTTNGLQIYNGSAWLAVASSTLTNIDGGMSDGVAPYLAGHATVTATQTVNGGTA
jgi:hypothetical protein